MGSGSASSASDTAATKVERPATHGGDLEPGETVGRYVVLEEIGRGGMGRVYRAADPQLDRDVAIKVLAESFDERARARAIREGHALARLSHPNVVEVFDVGVVNGSVFLAMEYVEGATLGPWCRGRDWREILDVFIQAGRGLLAAHEAGLVHRDFKPANVLIGLDGRARVGDFGLARASSDASVSESGSEAGPISSDHLSALTQRGLVVGTPAYMAPEQHRGDPVDARSDQYGFCIALYEALYGQRPFAGVDESALARAKQRGRVQIDRKSPAPRAVTDAVLRGLRPDPTERWPSMVGLLAALSDAGRRRRWPWVAAAGLLSAGVALVLPSKTEAGCEAAAERLTGSWSPERTSALSQAYEQSGRAYARETWAFAAPRFDTFVEHWAETRTDVCRSTPSGGLRDRQLACLDRLAQRFSVTSDWIAAEPEEAADSLAEIIADLGDPRRCATNPQQSFAGGPPSDEESFAEFRQSLDQGRALVSAGKTERGMEYLSRAHRQAIVLGYRPAIVRAERHLGEAKFSNGGLDEARDLLVSAYHDAISIGFDMEAARAANQLVGVMTRAANFDGAWKWSEHAAAATERADSIGLEADLAGRLAFLHGQLGQVDEQIAGHERALKLRREAVEDPNSASIVPELTNLGVAYRSVGRHEESRRMLDEALALKVRISGVGHPLTGQIHNQLGVTCRHLGEYEASRSHFESAIEVFEALGGSRHSRLAFARNNYVLLLRTVGDFEEAETQIRLALEQERQTKDADTPAFAAMMTNLAIVLNDLDRHAEARDVMLEVLDVHRRNYGDEHPSIAAAHANLGLFIEKLGDDAEARRHYEAALPIYESTLGKRHARVAIALNNLGTLLMRQGELERAESLHRRAMSIRSEALGEEHPDTATSMKNLADVLVARDETEAARKLYQGALSIRERALGADHERSRSTREALEALSAKAGG